MFNWKKTGILFAGLFLSVFWVWFSNSVQKEQNYSKLESVKLRAEVAKNSLQKLFNFSALKNSKVKKPFLFSLKLDAKTLAPKNFKVRKKEHLNLSALRIKTSFKESGMKQAFFLHGYSQKKSESFIVRVRTVNNDIYLDGLPLDYMANSLSYTFPNQSWYLLNSGNKVLISSNESKVGETFLGKSESTIKETFNFGVEPSILVVELQNPYSNALITFAGVAGVLLMTLSIFFMSGWGFDFGLRKAKPKTLGSSEDLGISGLTFEEEMTREIEGLTDDVEHMEMTPVENVKPAPRSTLKTPYENVVENEKTFETRKNSLNSSVSSTAKNPTKVPAKSNTEDLDYSDFLMENPVLGGADFLEDSDDGEEKAFADNSSQHTDNGNDAALESSPKGKSVSFDDSEVEEKQAEDWLKLAEDLTANLDEFAKTFEKEKSPLNPHRKPEEDPQIS